MKVEQILDQLLETQLANDDGLYLQGLFPCDWKHPFLPQSGKDTNIFATLTVHYILQGIQSELPFELRKKIIASRDGIEELLAKYQNKDGLETYNFWPTVNRVHFPGSVIFSKFAHFDIGDDLDDSALAFLVLNKPRPLAKKLHDRMAKHANGEKRWIVNTFEAFRKLPIYSTWFGTEKMPIEFDFCVLCNVLTFITAYDLDIKANDEAAIIFIKGIIYKGFFETEPYETSPYYGNTPVILYHFARLIATNHFSHFEQEKTIVLKWLEEKVPNYPEYGEQLLLLNTYLKLGGTNVGIFGSTVEKIVLGQPPKIDYFIAGLLGTQEIPQLRKLAKSKKSHIKYSSIAINLALLLETRLLFEK